MSARCKAAKPGMESAVSLRQACGLAYPHNDPYKDFSGARL
jgi:hypothetical protein